VYYVRPIRTHHQFVTSKPRGQIKYFILFFGVALPPTKFRSAAQSRQGRNTHP